MGIALETALRNQMLDAIQEQDEAEVDHHISLEMEVERRNEQKATYGKEFGSWA